MADGDFTLFVDIGEEWTLVVYVEGEDSVLVWESEGRAVDCAVFCAGRGLEVKAVVRGEHGEFELDCVGGLDLEWDVVVIGVFGQLDAEGLVDISLVKSEPQQGRNL